MDLFSSENPSSCGICIKNSIFILDKLQRSYCNDGRVEKSSKNKSQHDKFRLIILAAFIKQPKQTDREQNEAQPYTVYRKWLDRNTHHRTKEFTNLIDEFENSSRL